MCFFTDINEAIKKYADAYSSLNVLQDQQQQVASQSRWLPKGDQKTGLIGEYYALRYARKMYRTAESASNPSQKGWDITAHDTSGKEIKIQVKTVSAYSTTRAITPLHAGWDHLYLIHLDKAFQPDGFWILNNNSIMKDIKLPLTGLKMRVSENSDSGSSIIWGQTPGPVDELQKLLQILGGQ